MMGYWSGIRPDICIALRIIALHERYRCDQEFLEKMMTDDIVKRLRNGNELYHQPTVGMWVIDENKVDPLCQEAADEIEKLRAEILHWKYTVTNMTDFILAKIMWDAYAIQAGGKTFDGKPLPTWEELGEERQACWLAAASAAKAALGESDD